MNTDEVKTIRDRVDVLMTEHNISRSRLSVLTSLSESSINNFLSQAKNYCELPDDLTTSKISVQVLSKIAKVLHCSFDYLANGKEPNIFFKNAEGFEFAQVKEYEILVEDIEYNRSKLSICNNGEIRAFPKDFFDRFGGDYTNYFLIRTRLPGSPYSGVFAGDLLLIKKNNTAPNCIKNGTFCVFCTEYYCLLGELYYDFNTRTFYLAHAYGTAVITGRVGELYPAVHIERDWSFNQFGYGTNNLFEAN